MDTLDFDQSWILNLRSLVTCIELKLNSGKPAIELEVYLA